MTTVFSLNQINDIRGRTLRRPDTIVNDRIRQHILPFYNVSDQIWDYIKSTRAEVHDLENRLHNAKANVEQIQRLMSTWQDVPLYKRSEGKSTLLYLDDKEQRLNNRYKELDETGKKITGLLKENGELLKVENYDSDAWKNYVDYVDQMVLEGFRKIINCNLMFFLR
ncbi:unnamed protein product, partial [Rotaria magnacalcarata]